MKVFVSIPKGSIAEKFFFPPAIQTWLESLFEVEWLQSDHYLQRDEFALAVKDADVILTGWGHPGITCEMLRGSAVKLIAHTGGSVGNLIDPRLYATGVKVISGNPLFAESVAEGTLAYILTGLRRIPEQVSVVKSGGWHDRSPSTVGLLDQVVGIVGMGAISQRLIEMLQVFRVKVKIYSSHRIDPAFLKNHHAEQVSLDEIFSSCKIVSVHAALTEKTIGLIGKAQFDLLQDGALFVNTARGKIVCEDEMTEALRENRFYAVLDVFQEEPLTANHPLLALSNVYCFPHIAGPTQDRYSHITKQVIDNILEFEKGNEMSLLVSSETAARMTVNI